MNLWIFTRLQRIPSAAGVSWLSARETGDEEISAGVLAGMHADPRGWDKGGPERGRTGAQAAALFAPDSVRSGVHSFFPPIHVDRRASPLLLRCLPGGPHTGATAESALRYANEPYLLSTVVADG